MMDLGQSLLNYCAATRRHDGFKENRNGGSSFCESYFNSDHCYLLSSEQELVSTSRFGVHRPGWQVGNLATANSAILRSHLRAAPRLRLTFALIPPTSDRGVLRVMKVACTINLHHHLCRAGCLSQLAWKCCLHGWAGISYTCLCLRWFLALVSACFPA